MDLKGKKFLFHSGLMLGDTLMMTACIRDFKKQFPDVLIKVQTPFDALWFYNPNLSEFSGEPDFDWWVGPKILTQGSKSNGLHFTNAFRLSLQAKFKEICKEDVYIKQGKFIPDVHLSEVEKSKPIIEGKYWLINVDCGEKGKYSSKMWHKYRWQEVVDKLPEITFVQIGLKKDNQFKLEGENVIDFIGKTANSNNGLRDLLTLFYHSQGSLGLVSSQMHLAACFEKPCVVVAGAREPLTFEQYKFHRYISTQGCLPCARVDSCWAGTLEGCGGKRNGRITNGIAHCLDMITSDDVVRAVNMYYEGGLLEKPHQPKVFVSEHNQKLIKIVTNAHIWGGAERSVCQIANMFYNKGWKVQIIPRNGVHPEFKRRTQFAESSFNVSEECDVLLLYASDMIWDFHKPEFEVFGKSKAKRKVMALTYKIGKTLDIEWTRDWDLYLFLCSTLRDSLLGKWEKIIGAKDGIEEGKTYRDDAPSRCKVLAPPVDLDRFLKLRPNYDSALHLLRVSSQGDNKYSKDVPELMNQCDAQFTFMPGPSFISGTDKVTKFPQGFEAVDKFLRRGNCFWYLLPEGYTDQGPRVIMEAMASGLPVIAENRDGAKDRITDETGWLINKHDEFPDIVKTLTPQVLREKGEASQARARLEFKKENWLNEIIGK